MRSVEKKAGLILGGILLFSLVLVVGFVMATHQTSQEASAGASVTVATFIDMTLTDIGAVGFSFGSLDPGDTNIPEDDQTNVTVVIPAATVTRETTSNVDILIRLKGSNFVKPGDNIPITNVDYDDDEFVDQTTDTGIYTQETMSTAYPTGTGTNDPWATLTSSLPTVKIWFWLDVPPSQAAGTYSSTFSFQGTST